MADDFALLLEQLKNEGKPVQRTQWGLGNTHVDSLHPVAGTRFDELAARGKQAMASAAQRAADALVAEEKIARERALWALLPVEERGTKAMREGQQGFSFMCDALFNHHEERVSPNRIENGKEAEEYFYAIIRDDERSRRHETGARHDGTFAGNNIDVKFHRQTKKDKVDREGFPIPNRTKIWQEMSHEQRSRLSYIVVVWVTQHNWVRFYVFKPYD